MTTASFLLGCQVSILLGGTGTNIYMKGASNCFVVLRLNFNGALVSDIFIWGLKTPQIQISMHPLLLFKWTYVCISSYFKMRNIFLEWQQEWGLLLSILKVQTCSIIQASIGQAATLSQLGRKTQNFLQTWRTVKLCQKTWANQSWVKNKKDNNNTFQT